MKKGSYKTGPGKTPEGYISIPMFGADEWPRLKAHIEAQKLREASDNAKDVTPKTGGSW